MAKYFLWTFTERPQRKKKLKKLEEKERHQLEKDGEW